MYRHGSYNLLASSSRQGSGALGSSSRQGSAEILGQSSTRFGSRIIVNNVPSSGYVGHSSKQGSGVVGKPSENHYDDVPPPLTTRHESLITSGLMGQRHNSTSGLLSHHNIHEYSHMHGTGGSMGVRKAE